MLSGKYDLYCYRTSPEKNLQSKVIDWCDTAKKNKQMNRWVEHYSNLFSSQNTISPEGFDSLECLQTMDELDSIPTIEELNTAIHLTNDKAPRLGNISSYLIKKHKSALLLPLHEILCQCWQEVEVPQNMLLK